MSSGGGRGYRRNDNDSLSAGGGGYRRGADYHRDYRQQHAGGYNEYGSNEAGRYDTEESSVSRKYGGGNSGQATTNGKDQYGHGYAGNGGAAQAGDHGDTRSDRNERNERTERGPNCNDNGASVPAAISAVERQLATTQQDMREALLSHAGKENEKFDLIFSILIELQKRQAQLEESVRSIKAQFGGPHNGVTTGPGNVSNGQAPSQTQNQAQSQAGGQMANGGPAPANGYQMNGYMVPMCQQAYAPGTVVGADGAYYNPGVMLVPSPNLSNGMQMGGPYPQQFLPANSSPGPMGIHFHQQDSWANLDTASNAGSFNGAAGSLGADNDPNMSAQSPAGEESTAQDQEPKLAAPSEQQATDNRTPSEVSCERFKKLRDQLSAPDFDEEFIKKVDGGREET